MDIENLIRTQPQKADAYAKDWAGFLSKHPEAPPFVFKQEFVAWANTHHIQDTNVWVGKEIQDAYFFMRQQHEEQQLEQNGYVDPASIPSELIALPFLAAAFFQKPKTLEEDGDFIKIVKKKAEERLQQIPGIDDNEKIQSKEWIDYRYGSLENPEAPTLYEEAEKAFRDKALEDKQYAKRLEKYDKERDKRKKEISNNLKDDSAVIANRWRIECHAQALIAEKKKQNPNTTKEDEERIVQKVREHHWDKFVEKFPEKAKAYAEKHEGIKNAVARVEERKKQTAAQKIETRAVVQPITSPDIRPVENKLHRPLDISIEEASRQIEQAVSLQPSPPPKDTLVDTQGRILKSPPPVPQIPSPQISSQPFPTSEFAPSFSIQTQTARAPQYTQHVLSSGQHPRIPPIPRRVGNLLRPGNALSRAGGTLARQVAGRALLLLANPVVLSILLIFLFTFVIVIGIGPATTGEASPGTQIGNSIAPTPGTSGQIVPVGQGGTRIASAAHQISKQLLHNIKNADRISFTCDGANGRPLQRGQLDGYHCWSDSSSYDSAGDPLYLQCTELILAAYDIAGYKEKILKIFNAGGNAQHFAANAEKLKDDFHVFYDATQLRKGDIISLGADGLGHVAIVVDTGDNWVRVAQASTDDPDEVWNFDLNTGKLIPKFVERLSRQGRGGFIRLKES